MNHVSSGRWKKTGGKAAPPVWALATKAIIITPPPGNWGWRLTLQSPATSLWGGAVHAGKRSWLNSFLTCNYSCAVHAWRKSHFTECASTYSLNMPMCSSFPSIVSLIWALLATFNAFLSILSSGLVTASFIATLEVGYASVNMIKFLKNQLFRQNKTVYRVVSSLIWNLSVVSLVNWLIGNTQVIMGAVKIVMSENVSFLSG